MEKEKDAENALKQNKEYDTIIIGSGAGGLSAAICLARSGQKVLVLEQHDVPGGWCHSFYLNGYRFTPGVHYVGLLNKGESTSTLYEGLGIANNISFFRMNPKAYEHCWIGKERIDMPAGYENIKEVLAKRFPEEEKGVASYLKLVSDVCYELQLIPKVKGFWAHLTIPFRTKNMGKYSVFSLRKVIKKHIKSPLLKAVLNIQIGDHGLPPSKASFPLHAAVMGHYSSGGYYPIGGGGALVKAMTNAIKEHKGEIRTSKKVKQILLEGDKKKKATGVELESGEKIFAKRIISNADPDKTFLDLIGRNNISKKLSKRLDKTKYSCTSLMLFLTVDMDVRKAGLDSGNIWMMNNEDLDKVFEETQKIDLLEGDTFPGMFISCTTLKDPISFDGRYHTIEAITYINHKSFNAYKNEGDRRSESYLIFKEKLIKKMIRTLETVIPGVGDKIVQKELGTPITNEYYINSTNGCVYGTEKSFWQIGPFAYKAKSEIENLYLCGASVLSHGVAGAGYSGVETAAKILKCRQEDLILPDDNQNIRIYEAEDDSEYPDWMRKKIQVKKDRLAAGVGGFPEID
ncbi:NAD(P)/FAD-dependent oxidoreductase [Aquimarina sp. BL5]|uniref:phytoene desaturase family protein n=1 Tax=Aquimarina sp. BL5 TaxID=1714860 RepID=UPI000E506E0C|nr:NAD(P)/FAD-dependent oxidoreductase [Aquimarina sp. BL5]AXT49945.1 NAD(P)/FAD-dependent oxidoreductase [Aquimarina sp. BL5]RKN07468.1 FAD-binding protein [Aquimarina sp. BL5]